MNKYLALAAALLLTATAQSQTLTESWTGKLNVGSNSIRIVFNITKDSEGNTTCTLDSPNQGAMGIPATLTKSSPDSLIVRIPAIGAKYEGRIDDEVITGKFSQSGMTFDLVLKHGHIVLKRPQTPQPPFGYATEEVSFANKAGGATFGGTLTYPIGYKQMKKKSVPVVLMVTGSGQQNRDEEIFGHKPFLVIADYLAQHGIATLRYDDRAVGESKGDATQTTIITNANDAMAGLKYLRKSKKFGKIGVLGHSEGGSIAFIIGAKKKADFIVSLAGTAVRGDSILLDQIRIGMKQQGVPGSIYNDFGKAVREIYRYKIAHGKADNPQEVVNTILAQTQANLPVPMQQSLLKLLSSPNTWLNHFISYDPSKTISAVKCPVMAINGSLDTQVLSATNLGALRKLLPANKQNLIKEYEGLNHLFQHCQTGNSLEYNTIEETFSTEVLQDVADWIKRLEW